MKVLFWLSGSFDRRGPSEHLLTDMVKALYEKGHTVHILQKNTNGPQEALPASLRELNVGTTRVDFAPAQKSNLIARFMADVKYVFQCQNWLNEHNEFDRIFMQSSNVAGIQTRILRHAQKDIPVIFNVQDIFPENAVYSGKMKANGFVYKCFAFMQRHAYRYASKIITISEDMKDQLVEIGADADKVEVVYNWSYRDTMYAHDAIDFSCVEQIFDHNKFNVVYAGNIGVMQNVEIVIRAAARMREEKDIYFHIIGDGVYRKKLEQLADDLQANNVFFHDMLPSDCAPAIYSAADVNVIPLAKDVYRTALPSKTATCLACGKPIVFAVGKESKFVHKLSQRIDCVSVDADDVQALCKAVREIVDSNYTCCAQSVFTTSFGKTANSQRYAEIIESA